MLQSRCGNPEVIGWNRSAALAQADVDLCGIIRGGRIVREDVDAWGVEERLQLFPVAPFPVSRRESGKELPEHNDADSDSSHMAKDLHHGLFAPFVRRVCVGIDQDGCYRHKASSITEKSLWVSMNSR